MNGPREDHVHPTLAREAGETVQVVDLADLPGGY